ncbi:hypothetical protein [Cellulomonas soli]|uniref:Uncharacterized protein n=1 Tax=Cellulomonas soli TaxID=931535 RepID=A0A512PIJ1_9CELL|nr:hypothetical protein [Cellulomonas soli]NYI58662.1 hypothetical protein [Cellulomonas soli]GEP70952.1 hypothetical protein CSO01_36670 [Cellulomonas soli]
MRESTPSLARHQAAVAQAVWWAPSHVIAILGLVGGFGSLLTGQPIAVTLCAFSIVVIAGTSQIRTRHEFRRGWMYGYESAVRTALQYQVGATPDVEVRAAVHGDPIPEPWEVHVSPVLARRAS